MTLIKGTIALDIDGTLTNDPQFVDPMLIKFLYFLYKNHWNITLLTGRTLSFTRGALSFFESPVSVAVQNGATVLNYPSLGLISEALIEKKTMLELAKRSHEIGVSYTIESGVRNNDECFFVEKECHKRDLDYFKYRQSLSREQWSAISSIENYPFPQCATLKCFVDDIHIQSIKDAFLHLEVNTTSIRDPFRPNFSLVLVTHLNASKGKVIDRFKGPGHFVIAAGDDFNDADMLERADISIAMEHAPAEIRSLGDIVAKSSPQGLIDALKQAIERLERRTYDWNH